MNGGGKTSLDGIFGILGGTLKSSVNNGRDITNAKTCFEAFMDSAGIAGTTAALFNPVREHVVEVKKKCQYL